MRGYLLHQHRDIIITPSSSISIEFVSPPHLPVARHDGRGTVAPRCGRSRRGILAHDGQIRPVAVPMPVRARPFLTGANLEEARALREDESMEQVSSFPSGGADDNLHVARLAEDGKLILRSGDGSPIVGSILTMMPARGGRARRERRRSSHGQRPVDGLGLRHHRGRCWPGRKPGNGGWKVGRKEG